MTVPALRSIFRAAAAAALATLALTGAAQAHITLEQSTAPAGSTYKAVFREGHGCAGTATRAPRASKSAHSASVDGSLGVDR